MDKNSSEDQSKIEKAKIKEWNTRHGIIQTSVDIIDIGSNLHLIGLFLWNGESGVRKSLNLLNKKLLEKRINSQIRFLYRHFLKKLKSISKYNNFFEIFKGS